MKKYQRGIVFILIVVLVLALGAVVWAGEREELALKERYLIEKSARIRAEMEVLNKVEIPQLQKEMREFEAKKAKKEDKTK